jgi:hypothetical protein
MIDLMLREPLPMPEPHRTYAEARDQLAGCYARLSARLLAFASGLALWDDLDDRQRQELERALTALPAAALARYDDRYRDRAADSREFQVWAVLAEGRALGSALARMSSLLEDKTARHGSLARGRGQCCAGHTTPG